MTNFPEKIASALMESIMAAFRTETADLQRLADEVDAAGQDVEKFRGNRAAWQQANAGNGDDPYHAHRRGGGVQTRVGHWVNRVPAPERDRVTAARSASSAGIARWPRLGSACGR